MPSLSRSSGSLTSLSIRDEPSASPEHTLVVAGDHMLRSYPLRGTTSIIGRSTSCDVRVDHRWLSRQHAVLRLGDPTTVQDLGSKNGTAVGSSVLQGGEP